MLDKTKKVARLTKRAYVPLAKRLDYKEMERRHQTLGRRVKKHTAIEEDISMMASSISRYAQVHRLELIPAGKTHKLPAGGTLEWRMVGGRISCGQGNKTEDLVRVLQDPEINLGDCVETKEVPNESLLGERFAANPELVERIKEKLPGFSTGNPYELFVIGFAGEEKRVQGDVARGDFAVAVPDKRKKK